MQPQAFYQVVADDFAAVDGIIRNQLTSRVPLVEKIGDYITSAGGKRLRPLLVLLSGNALGLKGDQLRLLAAIIEFLHTSTLLHDDVVDMSGMRRGRSTANALWGNAPSVLVGDFLYARSFEMMVDLGSMPVMRIISQATRVIAEGEVLQLSKVRDASTTEDLNSAVDNAAGHFRHNYFDLRNFTGGRLIAYRIHHPGGAVNQEPSLIDFDAAVGNHIHIAAQLM